MSKNLLPLKFEDMNFGQANFGKFRALISAAHPYHSGKADLPKAFDSSQFVMDYNRDLAAGHNKDREGLG